MRLSEFIMLPQEEKRATVLQEGVPVAQRKLVDYMVFLFQLPDFYVETFCCKQTKEVQEYRVFHDPAHLWPYINTINVQQR